MSKCYYGNNDVERGKKANVNKRADNQMGKNASKNETEQQQQQQTITKNEIELPSFV